MKQASECASLVERADVTAFVQVTKQAGQCEIVGFGRSFVFLADDVVDLKAHEGVILEDQAILATPSGAGNDEPPKLGADIGVTHARQSFLP